MAGTWRLVCHACGTKFPWDTAIAMSRPCCDKPDIHDHRGAACWRCADSEEQLSLRLMGSASKATGLSPSELAFRVMVFGALTVRVPAHTKKVLLSEVRDEEAVPAG